MILIFKPLKSSGLVWLRKLSLAFSLIALNACTTMQVNVSNPLSLANKVAIQVGPIANHSDTPLANRQVESILAGLLHSHGFQNVTIYPRNSSCEKLLYCADEAVPNSRLIAHARQHHIGYILTGSANEWRYKVGLDGEPVAGVSLMLINVSTGKTIWTGVGSIIGGSRSGLDVVGQKLLSALIGSYVAI